MRRRLTKKFKHQLLVLLMLVLLMFYVIDKNAVATKTEELSAELADAEEEFRTATDRLVRRNAEAAELEKLSGLPPEKLTDIPPYDNLSELISRFEGVFEDVEPLLTFDDVTRDGDTAIRTVHFSFSADSYEEARSVLTRLTGTGWRCTLYSLSLTAQEGSSVNSGQVSVSGTVRFYEDATESESGE